MTTAEIGRLGEDAAAKDYIKCGYTVETKNYRTRQGEIDLIMCKNGMWIFCEVKARAGNSIAAPREWVDARKQRKIFLASVSYIRYKQLGEVPMRFDVVEVTVNNGTVININRIENAFDAEAYI